MASEHETIFDAMPDRHHQVAELLAGEPIADAGPDTLPGALRALLRDIDAQLVVLLDDRDRTNSRMKIPRSTSNAIWRGAGSRNGRGQHLERLGVAGDCYHPLLGEPQRRIAVDA